MELVMVNQNNEFSVENTFNDVLSTEKPFILSNTIPIPMREMTETHIIPVFVKDNEPLISHADFVSATQDIAYQVFKNDKILNPNIRVSHPIKGRIPDAKDKPAKELLESEKTIYYERMMFIIEIPSIQETIAGNTLSLTIGGVKSYNLDNLYNRKGADEHFKVFIGFQNKVCTNLCVWSDGLTLDLKVKNLSQLMKAIYEMVVQFKAEKQLFALQKLCQYELSEHEFATLIGRARLYNYLPMQEKKLIPQLAFGDTQIGVIAKDYYQDNSFCRRENGAINLWNVYNLFTGANKMSYIDTFLGRSVNAFEFITQLADSMENRTNNWFLN